MTAGTDLEAAALTPEPTPQKELEQLHGEKLATGVRVFVYGGRTWWKIDGLWYTFP